MSMYAQPSGAGLCVSTHRVEPERPRTALDGINLCGGCYDHLDRLLTAVPHLLADLERALIPGGTSGPKISGNPEKALPFNERAGATARVLVDFLHSWTRVITDDRGHALPADLSPAGLSYWHRTQLPWIAAQPWADEYAKNLRQNVGAARSALAGQRRKQVPLGNCLDEDRCDVLTRSGVRCGGVLTATLDLSDELLPATVACSVCGRDYTARELPSLGLRLTGGHAWLTTAQAAHILCLSQDRTRVLGLTEGWRLRDKPGVRPRRWHADDVAASQNRKTA